MAGAKHPGNLSLVVVKENGWPWGVLNLKYPFLEGRRDVSQKIKAICWPIHVWSARMPEKVTFEDFYVFFGCQIITYMEPQDAPLFIDPKLPFRHSSGYRDTLPETNIAPENRPSQKETSIPTIHFQVPWAMLVWGRVPINTPCGSMRPHYCESLRAQLETDLENHARWEAWTEGVSTRQKIGMVGYRNWLSGFKYPPWS